MTSPAVTTPAKAPKSGQAVGELNLSDRDFAEISSIVRDRSGIVLSDTKRSMVYSRLSKRLRKLGLASFSEYCALVRSDAAEAEELILAITTNVTAFFREPHHYELLRTHTLPPLIERLKAGGRVRLWSAACSNGQEVYSIAMVLLDMMPDAASHDLKILATDIDANVLAHGREGSYEADLLEPVDATLKRKFFQRDPSKDGHLKAVDELRRMVTFKRLNFMEPWPVKGPFDAVFCRNVVIYFDDPTKEHIWQQFAKVIPQDGWLMVGHSERIAGPAMEQFQSAGLTAYRRT